MPLCLMEFFSIGISSIEFFIIGYGLNDFSHAFWCLSIRYIGILYGVIWYNDISIASFDLVAFGIKVTVLMDFN